MTTDIKTYIDKDDHSIKVSLNTNLDINEIDKKINQIESNIYLNRLKEQYKQSLEKQTIDSWSTNKMYYDAMRLFCLDTQLISFNDVELMENEVNSSF